MSSTVSTSTGFYVYAFIRSADEVAVAESGLSGLDNEQIFVIAHDSIAIVVSNIGTKKIRPQRKYMAAHQEVVTHLSKHWSMLPVSFGLIADDLEQVRHILSANQGILNEQIDRVDGQVEMSVSLRWTADNTPQYFVDRYTVLSDARALIVSGNATREDQIELGRVFEKLLNAEREAHTQKFIDQLQPICKEIDIQPTLQESDVMKLACLIERDSEDAFQQAVYRCAELFSDDFAISFNGPWPPYSFVKLALSME